MPKTPKMSVIDANNLWRELGGEPHSIFNPETRKYEKFVRFEYNGQTIGPFKSREAYKKAAVDSYVQRFRVVPRFD